IINSHPVEPSLKDGNLFIKTERDDIVDIEYEHASSRDDSCVIEEKGIFLSGICYPSIEGFAYHRLKALVPRDFTAVSESEEIVKKRDLQGNLYSFSFSHPLQGINFIAGRYVVNEETFRGIQLRTYFFPEDKKSARGYLEYTKKYLRLYEDIVGKYPYKRLAVVESFLPVGYSRPTFTVLGRDMIKLPLTVKTTLGREILRQWVGNLVYSDIKKGNWTEGLTTYLSDHLYEEQQGKGMEYRKQILVDYENNTATDRELPLAEFASQDDFASKAVGYGKAAMVFHMLKELVGETTFFSALRSFIEEYRFKEASWDDIRTVYEDRSGKNLDWFFKQWLNWKGSPSLDVSNVVIQPKGLQYSVSFDLIQGDENYIFDISATVKTVSGQTTSLLRMNSKKGSFEIVTDGNPEKLVLDEKYDVFRKLDTEEAPPFIAKLLGDNKGLLVLRGEEEADVEGSPYAGATDFFKNKGFTIKKPDEVNDEDTGGSNLVLLGYDNPFVKRLFAGIKEPPPGFTIITRKNPYNLSKVVGIVNASSRKEADAAIGKITHYGKYSSAAFKKGVNIEKKLDESQRGWNMSIAKPVLGIEVAKTLTFSDIIDKVAHKKIVYIGEQHDRYEHHLTQFEAIKALYKKNPSLAIGMEMFQRPFQKALDDYIEGRTDEKQFLKSSEYFKRWAFDYNLYKDILRFARSEKIPVIALNMKREIVEKVAKSGIDSLTAEEKKELPDTMDMTDQDYRDRLQAVFERHESLRERDFNHFSQAQIVWDETMSQSIDDYIKKNPGRQMVVLTGGGHTMFASGIPKRTFRRNRLDYSIILNDQSVEPNIADFILFPKPATPVLSPKIMTILKEDAGNIKIAGFSEGSVSEKAGLKKDDIIVSLDGEKIGGIDDLKIFLFYKKHGDTISITVLRKGFLSREKELRFEVTL
ncbi:MAG TPA: ChaN family lipoprotein, partial [Thermodesulfovibrionales bacterium]|nr:ChaN family lipoprotein [Thermodesulfovibrionales bacterium]